MKLFYSHYLANTSDYVVPNEGIKEARIKTEQSDNSESQENLYPQMTLKGMSEYLIFTIDSSFKTLHKSANLMSSEWLHHNLDNSQLHMSQNIPLEILNKKRRLQRYRRDKTQEYKRKSAKRKSKRSKARNSKTRSPVIFLISP